MCCFKLKTTVGRKEYILMNILTILQKHIQIESLLDLELADFSADRSVVM